MKNLVFLLMVLAIFVIVEPLTTTDFATMLEEPTRQPIANVWSEPINGLSGRLSVKFEDLQPGLRYAVYLELGNQSFMPVAVVNQPEIHAELHNSSSKSVTVSGFPMSGPIPGPQWAVIPRDAYVGFRIDMQTVGTPTREQGMVLLAVGGRTWGLRIGEYVLETVLVFKQEEDAPQNQWVGELDLPPVEVVVTTQMLAMS